MRHYLTLSISAIALLSLSACSGAKEQLGLTRQAPDEFSVVKRAPLEMPPEFFLRPPRPGAARPQEDAPDVAGAQAVFGDDKRAANNDLSNAEADFLQNAGAVSADSSIRAVVDQETQELEPRNQPVAKKLLGFGRNAAPEATVVDAQAEAQRLKSNASEGRDILDGETPTIED